jgi:hypothetical protein
VTGVGTIKDDGTGNVFLATNTTGTPDTPTAPLDDDRPLSVTAIAPTVNEASPYAAFKVEGEPGQLASLSFVINTTDGAPLTAIEFWNGSNWVTYHAGDLIPLNSGGNALVRVLLAPEQDAGSDNSEPFSLTAANTQGVSAITPATVTIMDDGTGAVFASTNPSGLTPATIAVPDTAVVIAADATKLANDDRPLTITNLTVNEGSPYAVLSVGGVEGQYVKLSLTDGTATDNEDQTVLTNGTEDYSPAFEYFNGAAWVSYTPGSYVKIPSDGNGTAGEPANLLVRLAIINDNVADNSETFTLTATNASGIDDCNCTRSCFAEGSSVCDASTKSVSRIVGCVK